MPIQSTRYIYEDSFLAVPRVIFSNKNLSAAARLLYIHLLDRSKLSEKNGLMDDNGIFVYCTIEEAAKVIGCRLNKAHDTFDELLEQGYIEKKRQGLGRANKYYVNADPQGAETEEINNQSLDKSACGALENHNQPPEADLATVQNVISAPECDFSKDSQQSFQPISTSFHKKIPNVVPVRSISSTIKPNLPSESSILWTSDVDFTKDKMRALQRLNAYKINTNKNEPNNNK